MQRAAIVMLVLASCVEPVEPPDEATETTDLGLMSSDGITVTGTRWISDRTIEADVATVMVDPIAVNGPHRIRITLPSFYAQKARGILGCELAS